MNILYNIFVLYVILYVNKIIINSDFFIRCIDKSEEDNFEASGGHGNENISKEQLDEELISFVQQRPALYDHRIPSQERTKLKKRDLWQQVSNCLGGKVVI